MSEIEHVSDTARWVAVYRAMETARPDAIFRDPYAARLAGDKGHAIVDAVKSGRSMAWAMIVRTAVFDEIIRERIRNGGADQIVNLAAGLDARPWRMTDLPPSLHWVDVDLPGILDHKLEIMKDAQPICHYDALRVDLRDAHARREAFAKLGANAERTLVVTEGLLIYLTRDHVGALATDLHAEPTFCWWLIDLASPALLEMMRKFWAKSVESAPFQFAPVEGSRFFEAYGWTEAEYRATIEEAHRFKREMKLGWLFRFLARFRSENAREEGRRFSGYVLLERM